MLAQAERSVAAAFGFPRAVAAGTVSTSTITSPSDLLAVLGLSVGVLQLQKAERRLLSTYNYSAYPRFYFHDPAIGGDITVAPTPSSGLPYTLTYVVKLPETRTSGDVVWNGLFEPFHEVVSMLAAGRAYEKGAASYELSAYWMQKASLMLKDIAGYLAQHGYHIAPNVLAQLTTPGGKG